MMMIVNYSREWLVPRCELGRPSRCNDLQLPHYII